MLRIHIHDDHGEIDVVTADPALVELLSMHPDTASAVADYRSANDDHHLAPVA